MTDSNARVPLPWLVLHSSLCLSAGHGIAMYFLVSRVHLVPSINDMGDAEVAVWVAWFLLSVPLALASFLLRERLVRAASSRVGVLAALALGITLVAFLRHALVIARG